MDGMRHVDTPQSICHCGIARCDITPPVGIYHRMWGAATHDQATGTHRPLTGTALVFQPDTHITSGAQQVVVAVDHCLLWAREMDELLASVATQTAVPRERLAIAFSHTHSGGLLDCSRAHLPGGSLIRPYLDELAVKITAAISEAQAAASPVTFTYGAGRCPLAAHRDYLDEVRGEYVCGFNPEGPADDTVLVVRISDLAGRTLATVVNYACHPTTLAWENTLISPDYPGAMREVVEAATGAPCLFLQGASGDIGPREGFVGDPAVADHNGRQLGFAVLAALEALPPPRTRFRYAGPVVSGATLGTWEHVPLDAAMEEGKRRWRARHWTVELPYRDELPTLEQTQAARARWLAEEESARTTGDELKARDCRAMVERQDRWLTRQATLPRGKSFPFPISLWQLGDAIWLGVEAELYNVFQRELRLRFPGMPLVIMTLVNGARPTYLPPAEVYGKNTYQESIAVLAPGSLEQLLAGISSQIESWLASPSSQGDSHCSLPSCLRNP
jgi:hypothetical protein